MALNDAQKKEALQSALCVAFGTSLIVLVLEFFRIPNCYLSLSLAATLSLLPTCLFSHLVARIVALSLGILSAMLVLIAFPQAPWFYLPLAGVIPAVGYAIFFKHSGPGSAFAFSAFFLAFHITIVSKNFSEDLIIEALNLWCQAAITIVIVHLVSIVIKEKKPLTNYAKFNFSSMVSIGLTVCVAIILETMIKSDQAARLVMASISTIATLEIEKSTDLFLQRMLGYVLGAVIATGFIISLVAIGNNIAIYLLALGSLFGFLEWIACFFNKQATLYRAITAMISFSIFMTPAPDMNFNIAYERIANSLIAFFTAIIVFLIVRECKKITERLMASLESQINIPELTGD